MQEVYWIFWTLCDTKSWAIKRREIEMKQKYWEKKFLNFFKNEPLDDASHDISHFRRVAQIAFSIASLEKQPVDLLTLLAAAYFHDLVTLPKNHPENCFSSRYSAIKARTILEDMQFPPEKLPSVCHAIETHSFSAGLTPNTIEAKIVQDADRMESLGAIGILRTFYVSGKLNILPFDPNDLFAEKRPLDDKNFGLDHFYCKLFKLENLMQTEGGRKIAHERTAFLHVFVKEVSVDFKKGDGGTLQVISKCVEAGQTHKKLFEPSDPLATHRKLEPDSYAVDGLIVLKEKYPEFIPSFLQQLQKESG